MSPSDRISTATLVKALQAEATAFFDSYFTEAQKFSSVWAHRQDHFNNIQNLVNIIQARKSQTFLDKIFKEVRS